MLLALLLLTLASEPRTGNTPADSQLVAAGCQGRIAHRVSANPRATTLKAQPAARKEQPAAANGSEATSKQQPNPNPPQGTRHETVAKVNEDASKSHRRRIERATEPQR